MPPEDRLIHLLTGAHKALLRSANDRLARADVGVPAAQAAALFVLKDGGAATMTGLSRAIHADNAAVTRMVDRLEQSGLVTRTVDPGDRRAFLVALTGSGRRAAGRAARVIRGFNQEIRNGLAPERWDVLVEVLGGLIADHGGN